MEQVDVVPNVFEVVRSSVNELKSIVEARVGETDEHGPAKLYSILVMSVQVDLVDVDGENQHVDEVNYRSVDVNVLCIAIPLVLKEVDNHLRLEDIQLRCFTQLIH